MQKRVRFGEAFEGVRVGFSKLAVLMICVASMIALTANPAHAQTDLRIEPLLNSSSQTPTTDTSAHRLNLPSGVLLAQTDDSYDPFADYSEFDEAVDEEEDLNFFRNGRLLTLGFIGGVRGWTGTLNKIYTTNMSFGLFLCYFFDLRFALQFGFLTSDHTLNVVSPTAAFTTIRGNVNMTEITANLKYYFNTQNVTRGLADLNPYILGGFSQIYRTTTVSGETDYGKDSAFAANIGAGIEIPMLRNKLFVGLQAAFQYVMFTDEAKVLVDTDSISTGVSPAGDSFTVLGVLGVNF